MEIRIIKVLLYIIYMYIYIYTHIYTYIYIYIYIYTVYISIPMRGQIKGSDRSLNRLSTLTTGWITNYGFL